MQGQSLVPFLKRYIPMDWRQGFFYEHHAGMKNIPPSEGVRSERFKYIRWLDPTPEGIKDGHARLEQLFELDSDPLEKKDLAADPKYAQILDQSREVWQYQRKELE
jgi:arylsulfatase A-like enzyme